MEVPAEAAVPVVLPLLNEERPVADAPEEAEVPAEPQKPAAITRNATGKQKASGHNKASHAKHGE